MCCSLTVAVRTSGLEDWGYLQLAAAITIGLAAMVEALWAVWGIDESSNRLSWLLAVAAVVVAEIAAAYFLFPRSTAHLREFAGYRAIHIESGTSPLLPVIFLLAAIYLFSWLRLSRLRTNEERHAAAPTGEDARAFPGLSIPEGVQQLGPVPTGDRWQRRLLGMVGFIQPPSRHGLSREKPSMMYFYPRSRPSS